MRQVKLNNQDVSQYVTEIPAIAYQQSDFGQLAINDITSITGDNRGGFWDQGNSASPFYNATDLSAYKIDIYNDNVLVFTGSVQTLQANNDSSTSMVNLKSSLQSALDKGIAYASTLKDTPANIVKEICDLYKIPYDSDSLSTANAVYNANLIYISALFKAEGTIMDALQQLAEFGIARVYNYNNKLAFDVFQTKTTPVVFTFTDSEYSTDGVLLFSHPLIEPVEKEKIEGYAIKMVGIAGADTAIRGTTTQQGKQLDGSYGSSVRVMTFPAAVWIGERWYEYLNKTQYKITFGVPIRYGKSLALGNPVALSYRGRSYTVDITAIDNSNKIMSTLTGVTR